VITVRSLLARALAGLLLLQWSGGPAHCLATAAFSPDAGVICHADTGTSGNPGDPPGGLSPDQVCPACHALGQLVLPASPTALPQRIEWLAPVAPPPEPIVPTAPRASPLQARAPPEASV
jgi:hypothetical protein